MKKIIKSFFAISFLFAFHSQLFGQITLEYVYPGAMQKLYMINFEISGMKYLVKSDVQGNRFLKFYNLNHSLWKTINCNSFPTTELCGSPGTFIYNFDALYISETLFDCDTAIEFMYFSQSDCRWFTSIYKENGTALLVADSSAPLVKINIPQQYRPIYNTPLGTKLILSHKNGTARVYDLPCSLTTVIDQMLPWDNNNSDFTVFPNPSSNKTTIEYHLPNEINQAEIILTDSRGIEVKRYHVDNNFCNIVIDQNEIAPGLYFYTLIAQDKILNSKKIIIIK
ncbi:MAG: T9SS type A sorting domain-containing protein [Bacteroidota bacterium]